MITVNHTQTYDPWLFDIKRSILCCPHVEEPSHRIVLCICKIRCIKVILSLILCCYLWAPLGPLQGALLMTSLRHVWRQRVVRPNVYIVERCPWSRRKFKEQYWRLTKPIGITIRYRLCLVSVFQMLSHGIRLKSSTRAHVSTFLLTTHGLCCCCFLGRF
jgi:hypothetical protein